MTPKRNKSTKDLATRTQDVMQALNVLRWMDRFPDEEDKLILISRIIARFCETVAVNTDAPDDPEWTAKYGMGWVTPLDYMIEQVATSCTRFPPPIVFRRFYEQKFVPLDGKWASDLESVATGRE